jgi:hypothetical protein
MYRQLRLDEEALVDRLVAENGELATALYVM